ncbi:type II secretion system minor pseudopilin GspK [Legionella septentrionalis]|uniref:type II secretion system minor pseudopilin GspK n=1 Tax=Legionella septentrionalis TaxID=2498109 RepID=UPI000F8E9475|nr:type II secretion system minor pseudopilin GspK [Legionella septentrionalis]RUQ95137.1 general secretion pathway protein GspK [Legionella septentrionalis]RUR08888.1 general secretion pathway protein GspK [Legionella septentrionalis]RUR13402.1 general secretion pathway protein GspK [Legionella septentrionalis]
MAHKYHALRGSALLSALFIMTLVAIAATAMSLHLQLDIYRTRLTILSDKMYLASQAVSFWAMDRLHTKNLIVSNVDAEGKLEEFPKNLQQIYPGITIHGGLYDLQARFNLNNVQDRKYRVSFLKLLEQILPKTNAAQRRLLVDATVNWITPYTLGQGQDNFLTYYLQQHPPYLPSHFPMQSVSEFRLLQGVDAAIYQTLLPYVTALPEVTPINVNTAAKPVLRILGNGLNDTQVNTFIEARQQKTLDNKNLIALLQRFDIPREQITLESQYFLSVAITKAEGLTFINYTVIRRSKDKNGNLIVSIINESLNTL